MKRDMESEYLSAVAKRTRASSERFWLAKLYGESGVRNRKRIPDLEVVSDDDEAERDEDRARNRKVRVKPIPDLEVESDDDDEDEAGRDVNRKESGVKVVRRKGKEKMVVEEKDFFARAGFDVGSEEESESVRDNDESNSRCKGRKDVGDDSVGSRTELGNTSKPVVDVDETVSVGVIGNCVENENGKEGSGNNVSVSSEEELGTEVSSSDSEEEDDDSDEDYDERMADLSCCSESASESYADFVEEVALRDRRQEESYGVECNDNEDCNYKISDNVIILDDDFAVNENDVSYAKPVAEEILMGGTKEKENVVVYSPNNDDRLDGENMFTGKGFSSKSAPTANKLKENRTKVDDFVWIAFKENSNHLENKFSKSTCHAQGSAKNNPEVEVTSAWDGGTVQNANRSKTHTLKSTSSVEPGMLAESGLIWGINGKQNVSKINSEAGFSRGIEDNNNNNEKPFVVGSVPHIKSSNRSMVNPGNTFADKASKTMTGHGEDRMPKDYNSNDFVSTGDDAKKTQQQGVYHGRCRKAYSTKRTRSWEKIDLFDILFNTLTSKSGGVHEDVVNATDVRQQENHAEVAAPKSYPMLKFTFGVKAPVQVEKTEFEQELDKLWDEFQFELRASEIGSHAHGSVKTDKDTSLKNDKIYPTLCNRGEHKFTLDDEVGIKCQICSFVQLEMKYVMPDWKIFSSRRFNRTSSSDDEVLAMVDRMQFHDHDSKVGESRSYTGGTVWDLIPDVRVQLFPHQQDGFEFIWQNLMGTISLDELRSSTNHGMGGCIISHAPGTGKTRLTIEFLHSYLKLFPCSCPLIITPAGMLLTWEAEFKKWGVDTPFHNLNSDCLSGKEDKTALKMLNVSKQKSTVKLLRLIKLLSWKKGNAILGLSYSLFEKLAGQRFDKKKVSHSRNDMDEQAKEFGKIILENAGLLVLDEGHTPRNPRSRIYKALISIQTKKRVILSGTPFQNNLAELFTILSFVRPDFEQTISPELRKFCQRKVRMVYGSSGRSGTETNVDRDDLQAISQLKTKFDPFVHVHKGSVLQESLPGLKDCVMVLSPPQYQKRLVEMIESNSYTNFEFEHKLSLATIHPSLLRNEEESFIDKRELEARRFEPNEGVKTKFLFEMIKLSEANNEKVLVFSQYLDPLGLIKDQICSLLQWREGEEVLQLVGKIESEQRQSIINAFNNPNSSAKVLLASTKACSEGINLVGASRVVLLDVVWNPSVERQAISRAFRLGQKNVVYSYNLIVGRMEWEKYRAQTDKEHVSNLVFCSSDETKKRSLVLSEDIILDKLMNHSSMEGMFERIVYHPKDILFS